MARLAGILAAKRTAEAIPLCHPLPLTHVDVDLAPRRDGFEIEARVRTDARTGAEMEALHAVAVAALTVYDMVKAVGQGDAHRRRSASSGRPAAGAATTGPGDAGIRRPPVHCRRTASDGLDGV